MVLKENMGQPNEITIKVYKNELKKNPPLFSIIMPTYNRGYIIETAIDSLKEQTYKNFELIIIDDGSDDNTEEIVQQIRGIEIVYIKYRENKGASFARNLGMKYARGDFFSFLDSDNVYTTNSLENRMRALNEGYEFVFGQAEIHRWERVRIVPENVGNSFEKIDDIIQSSIRKNIFDTNTVALSRKCFDECGGFDEKQQRLQDYEYFFRLLITRKYKFKFINTIVAIVYVQKDSVSTNYEYLFDCRFRIFKKNVEEIRKYKCVNELTKELIGHNNLKTKPYNKRDLVEMFIPLLKNDEFEYLLESLSDKSLPVEHEYFFPYHLFPHNARIIIYGSGIIGRVFYHQSMDYKYVKTVAIVDSNFKEIKKNFSFVENVDAITKYEFDFILVAIIDKDSTKKAIHDLLSRGVEEWRIKWDGNTYTRKNFLSWYLHILHKEEFFFS